MKKLTILIMIIISCTACTAVRIDTKSIDNITDVVLSKQNTLYNRVGKGYKYYIPRGVSYIDTNELNDILYSNGNYYYLYVDAVSYFYKAKIEYKEDKTLYYSKKIDNGNKGYLQIKKQGDKYLIKFVYNYARIESLVSKKEIEEVVLNSSYILSTVKFNDKIIELMLNDEYFTNKEEQYDVFQPKKEKEKDTTKFLKYEDEEEK